MALVSLFPYWCSVELWQRSGSKLNYGLWMQTSVISRNPVCLNVKPKSTVWAFQISLGSEVHKSVCQKSKHKLNLMQLCTLISMYKWHLYSHCRQLTRAVYLFNFSAWHFCAQREQLELAIHKITPSWQPLEWCRWASFLNKRQYLVILTFFSLSCWFAPSSVSSSLFLLRSTIIPLFVLLISICVFISLFCIPSDCPPPPLICLAANHTHANKCSHLPFDLNIVQMEV